MGDKITMIYFLFGPDTYRSKQKLREIVEEYKKSHKSGLNLIRINFNEKDLPAGKAGFSDFKQVLETVSMFGEKKLIILEDFFAQPVGFREELCDYLERKKIAEDKDRIIVFWAEKIEPKDKLCNFLRKKAEVQKFELLQPYKLKEWIKKYVREQGGSIENQASEKLVDYVGNDLWRMSNELDKLITFDKKIKVEDVEKLVKPKIDINIFHIIDALGQRNKKQALKLVHNYFAKGENQGYLFDRFIYQFRNLIKVKTGGGKNLHPFVFRKSQFQAKNFPLEDLKKIYRKLLEIDLGIKTGKIDIRTALELFVTGL